MVRALKDGLAVVSVKAIDGSFVSDSKTISISGFKTLTIKYLEDHKISMFPNPVTDKLYVSSESNERVQLKIFDVIGNIQVEELLNGTSLVELDLKNLAKGYYTVSFSINGEETFHTIIKD